jgi:hypothetical protein
MVIAQKPNLSIIIAALGWVIGKTTTGAFHSFGVTVSTIAIIIWAYQEAATGVNWFRKALGVIVLLIVAYSLFTQLR